MVQLKRNAVEHTLAVGAGVGAPLAIEVMGKGKKVSIGKMKVKASALVGVVGGGLAVLAGATETGVRGDLADDLMLAGAGALATGIGLHLLSPKAARRKAGLADDIITLAGPDEIILGEGLESYDADAGASFGFAEVKEY